MTTLRPHGVGGEKREQQLCGSFFTPYHVSNTSRREVAAAGIGFALSRKVPKPGRDLKELPVLIKPLFGGSRSAAERQNHRVYSLVVDCALLSKNQCVADGIADNCTRK